MPYATVISGQTEKKEFFRSRPPAAPTPFSICPDVCQGLEPDIYFEILLNQRPGRARISRLDGWGVGIRLWGLSCRLFHAHRRSPTCSKSCTSATTPPERN